ncbi:APC family permease [Lawsonibacter faecis]|uniref:Amino acid permease n=1 Tax=Lawsonibacter faecis TaxID=2763052 RepID=A0A8J6JM52_9FIRM|nr:MULTISPECIES: APC family permease [Oscillospiraceae]MTQ96073.1 amino acid permease [Pseudoflavonifractor sp. BIOML-A16]MTR06213.1 amino acid permease [Pseudoflavonifractor sp. BIOML-A15]MTR33506.1 amino acid permease [Pseudoflavonifractor sp. BIOML-A14]MTR73373.1 amino acid permease [Pseudoflavonifractor sp. BIOML-A18]MTS63951.1 amino acid permease [Pseudoflavonifractor sp. BIOML-A5]MTS72203.1 amino acid permease [Pseudoflavonifractor sp. BIOML-A8]MTS92510.1 amino acid permease [Pseudofla
MSNQSAATGELKRNLGRMDLVSVAVGQIIGAGIMAMTGTAIGMTGRSVNLAFVIAGILCVLTAIPQIMVGGTARFKGGQYTQVAAFGGQRLAGIFTLINVFTGLGIAMYVISFTEYLLALVPGAPAKLISVAVLTILFLMNILGAKQAAVLQTVMCVIMAVAIAAFIAFGVPNLQPGYFAPPDFMTKGLTGVLMASAYLSFAAGGAQYVINFSGEAKNPKKDIPFAIIVPTIAISVVYAVMGTIAAGVLPVADVANKSLALVAEAILPKPLYVFFIVGGAMFALLTTLNASIGWMCRPIVQAAKDGWLPKVFGRLNARFGTPVNVLLLFYVIGLVPILAGLDISIVSSSTVILTSAVKVILCFTAIRLPKVMPELWSKSKFHVGKGLLNTVCIVGGLVATLQVLLMLATSAPLELVGNLVILAASVVYALAANKRVKMEVSYEDCD